MLSGQNDETNARHARTLGAIEFIAKPCEPEVLKDLLPRRCRSREAEQRPRTGDSRHRSATACRSTSCASRSPVCERAVPGADRRRIRQRQGAGRAVAAPQSPRAAKPFLALNCAAISPTLVEPTLFGYAKGAFTGATTSRSGYFEDAQDGTLFLDEIGELPLELQAKLLRVLENGEFQRVGETQSRVSNARVIAATNRDLRQEVRAGRFRADLYHRLSVFTIAVPPLRELGEDKRRCSIITRAIYARQSGVQAVRARPRSRWSCGWNTVSRATCASCAIS